jgi:preprotein translocase subunit YajC
MHFLFYLQSGGGAGALLSNYGLLMLMLVVIWLFFFRPQAKKQKAQAKFIQEIQKGDEVATMSGLIGRVNKIEDSIVTLQVDQKSFIRVTKGSISKEMTDVVQKATATTPVSSES